MTLPQASYSLETQGQLEPGLHLEWLLTNGMGAFASSTVVGCNTRRYHGLLCAAVNPPVGRLMAVNRIGEIVCFDAQTEFRHEFSVNQFRQTFHPRGHSYLRQFDLNAVARWDFQIENVNIVKEVQLVWNRNIAGVRYTIDPPNGRHVELQLLPFISLRDFHRLRNSNDARFQTSGSGKTATLTDGERSVYMQADDGEFVPHANWWYGHTYAIETERGQDDTEDLFTPGAFVFKTSTKASITLWLGIEPPGMLDWDVELSRRPKTPVPPVASRATCQQPRALVRLARAAGDFIVQRGFPDGTAGSTVLAGYPWFADWGRDTMISLPGLLLSTQRFREAAQVLGLFADYVSEGMIPNRFDDYTNEPHYNTVDASLWFIHAAYEYLRLSGDHAFFDAKLKGACEAIIAGYEKGTRFRIGMDPADGLITAGDAHSQLTWMDAKCGGIVFTPRHGKAVEINALWYNALKLTGRDQLAAKAADSFCKRFWLNPFRGLCDVINDQTTPPTRDTSLRPNQIFAVSLPYSPLNEDQQFAVVEAVRRELLTPYGLRTLNAGDLRYKARYTGNGMQRDGAYHNGTVWPWLIGHFIDAHLRVHHRSAAAITQAREWLQPLLNHMESQACIGQISEIFDGDEPHRPAGCFGQAWSVAEVLRSLVQLELLSSEG